MGRTEKCLSDKKGRRLLKDWVVESEREEEDRVRHSHSYIAGRSIWAAGGLMVHLLNQGNLGGECVGRRRSVRGGVR